MSTYNEAWELAKNPEIIAAVITGFFVILKYLFRPKARVIWGSGHQFCFGIPQPDGSKLLIETKSFSVRNSGRAPAKDIEIFFNYKPEHFQIWPPLRYTTEENPGGHFIIKMDLLGSGEYFNIEAIHSRDSLPDLLKIRSYEGESKNVIMAPLRIFPQWINFMFLLGCGLGIYKILEWAIRLIQNLL